LRRERWALVSGKPDKAMRIYIRRTTAAVEIRRMARETPFGVSLGSLVLSGATGCAYWAGPAPRVTVVVWLAPDLSW
jgi:hypothetical protein